MRILVEEVDELLSRAKYLVKKDPTTPLSLEYWNRLKSAYDQAREVCPELQRVVPDESHKTWADALLCLELVNKGRRDPSKA